MPVTTNLGENEPVRHSSAGGINSQDERRRSAGLAERCTLTHRRPSSSPAGRAAALELDAKSIIRLRSGGLIMHVNNHHVTTITRVAETSVKVRNGYRTSPMKWKGSMASGRRHGVHRLRHRKPHRDDQNAQRRSLTAQALASARMTNLAAHAGCLRRKGQPIADDQAAGECYRSGAPHRHLPSRKNEAGSTLKASDSCSRASTVGEFSSRSIIPTSSRGSRYRRTEDFARAS